MKEVYAFYGLAAYQGQVLEGELLLFATALDVVGRTGVTRGYVNKLMDHFETQTFGTLLKALKARTTVSAELETRLAAALKCRNDLAHRFFARHTVNFMSDAGRIVMIEELRGLVRLFEEVDEAVTAVRRPLFQKMGLTEEKVKEARDKMVGEASENAGR